MEHIIILEMGDPSNDGHGQTHQYVVKSNFSAGAISEMYKQASAQYSLDITNECTDYEDRTPRISFVNKFNTVFANNQYASKLLSMNEDDEVESIWYDTHAEIYLLIAQLANPELKWEETTNNLLIGIGGYGYGS